MMDLEAYTNIPTFESYVIKHYGEVPRLRGIMLMKLEKPTGEPGCQMQVFDECCGKDIIYIHTRCGSASWGDSDPNANYIGCGGKEWEEANSETFIKSLNDEWDGTYRDHYFKAVIDDDYRLLIATENGDAQ